MSRHAGATSAVIREPSRRLLTSDLALMVATISFSREVMVAVDIVVVVDIDVTLMMLTQFNRSDYPLNGVRTVVVHGSSK